MGDQVMKKKDWKVQWGEGLVKQHEKYASQATTMAERVYHEGLAAQYRESVEIRKAEVEWGFE